MPPQPIPAPLAPTSGTPPTSSSDAQPAIEPRQRLIEGMAAAIAARGYAATTVADVVREAGVSKRTFYEHFTAKEPCFLALYALITHKGLAAMKAAVNPQAPWPEQVAAGLSAWFAFLARAPRLLRPMFIELPALGEAGLAARREAMRALTDYLIACAQATGGHAPLSPEIALALVGGISELIMVAIEDERLDRITELAEPAGRLVALATGVALPR